MKYNDYPENLPDVLIEKLNQGYNEASQALNKKNIESRAADYLSQLATLSNSEASSLVEKVICSLDMLVDYLHNYNKRSNGAMIKQNLTTLTQSLQSVKDNYIASFGFTPTEQNQALHQTTTRKWLRDRITHLFYTTLANMIILYENTPANFGLKNSTATVLDSFYSFITLPM